LAFSATPASSLTGVTPSGCRSLRAYLKPLVERAFQHGWAQTSSA
jgi:hypothetical protein